MADPFGGALPITTPDVPVYEEQFLSDFPSTNSEVLGAEYGNAATNWPVAQIDRTRRMGEAEYGLPARAGTYPGGPGFNTAPDSPLLTPDAAKAKIEAGGLQGQIEVPESGMRQRSLDLLMEHRVEQNRRNAILARSPGGFALNAAGVVGTLAISALDPLNVATAFIPVVGEARYAKLIASAGESVLARTAVRAGVGAVEGAAGGALLEPINYAASKAYQDDYTMNDALANTVFNGLFGAAIHQLPAAASWAFGKMRRGVPLEYQKAAFSEALSAFIEDRQPRVTEMLEGIRRGDLMASTSLGRAGAGERFDPTQAPGRFEPPEAGAVRAPDEEYRANRTAAVEARAREIEPEAFTEHDRLTKERETYTRWIDELKGTRDTAATAGVKDLDDQITATKAQMEGANQRKTKTYQKRLDDLQAERAARVDAATKADTPDMATVRAKLQQADFRLRDLAETVSAAKRKAEADIPERSGVNEAANVAPDRDDLAAPGAVAGPDSPRATLQQLFDATAPDLRDRSLTGVLTRIRDDRVNLPPDDARMAAETTRATPLYNKPLTPESGEAEVTAYALATDEALATMQSTGRLTEADMALLADADQMVAQSEQVGSGWKAATACIARAFT